MPKLHRKRRLWDEYRFRGFSPSPAVKGIFGDPQARVLALTRRSKKRGAARVDGCTTPGTIGRPAACGISPVAIAGSTWTWKFDESPAGVAAR